MVSLREMCGEGLQTFVNGIGQWNHNYLLLRKCVYSRESSQAGFEVRCNLGNMNKMAACSGLPSGYFICP